MRRSHFSSGYSFPSPGCAFIQFQPSPSSDFTFWRQPGKGRVFTKISASWLACRVIFSGNFALFRSYFKLPALTPHGSELIESLFPQTRLTTRQGSRNLSVGCRLNLRNEASGRCSDWNSKVKQSWWRRYPVLCAGVLFLLSSQTLHGQQNLPGNPDPERSQTESESYQNSAEFRACGGRRIHDRTGGPDQSGFSWQAGVGGAEGRWPGWANHSAFGRRHRRIRSDAQSGSQSDCRRPLCLLQRPDRDGKHRQIQLQSDHRFRQRSTPWRALLR